MARYIDWCAAFSRNMRMWQVIGLSLLATAGLIICIEVAPGWVASVYFLVITPPVGILCHVAFWAINKRLANVEDQKKQLHKTQELLKGFRK